MTKESTEERMLIKLLASQNQYTLVEYPVAYHYDRFWNGGDLLENKICFEYNSEGKDNNVGRGGSGPNKFVFTLLD